MHQGRPHFDPTMALPEDGWMSFQGIPHEYPTEGAPLELTLAYGEEDSDPSLWQRMRRAVEPETGAEMAGLVGASIAPGLGEAVDVIDFIAGVEDGDWARSSWAAAGLLLPFVAGSTLRKVGGEVADAVKGAPDIEAPNIQTVTKTSAADVAEGQRNLRGIMDYEAPDIQGTMPDVSLYTPGSSPHRTTTRDYFSGTPSPFTEKLLNSRTVPEVLDADYERGLGLMGERAAHRWYELGPVKQFVEELDGPYDFTEFNLFGGALSSQTPVHQEIANTTIDMFRRKRGMTLDEAIQEYHRTTGVPRGVNEKGLPANPWGLNADAVARVGRYLDEGVARPMQWDSQDWKIPSYVGARMGQNTDPRAMVPLDTHERRRIYQAIQQNPRLAREADRIWTAKQSAEAAEKSTIPIRNAPDYNRITDLYRGGQERFGLLTPSQYQAPRWVGGGQHTGLKSSPTSTFAEILADVTAQTARDRGLGTSPADLRTLLGRALRGDDFLINYSNAPMPR